MFKKLKHLLFGSKDQGSRQSPARSKTSAASGADVTELLVALMQEPSKENYLRLRTEVVAMEQYKPYSSEIEDAGHLFEQEQLEQAMEVLKSGMPNLILSPSAHQFMAMLYSKTGEEQGVQAEMMIAIACIEGIMATGDGSKKNPYVVLRTSDEYDVLEYMEKEMKQQALVNNGDTTLDLITCTDGSKYYFDITDAFSRVLK